VNVLKNKSLIDAIKTYNNGNVRNLKIHDDFHFGGFAKVPEDLISFSRQFWTKYNILLDPIYNAKMMYAAMKAIEEGRIPSNSNVLCIHTGGLQGIKAFEYVSGKNWV
jgi:1-aminocyclopropane-1-carboxylate deaminase